MPAYDGLAPVIQGGAVVAAGAAGGSWTVTDGEGDRSVLTVVEPPAVQIVNPDDTGGEDYATASSGDPWDFQQPTDAQEVGGVNQATFADGRLTARNTPRDPGDPFVSMRMGAVPLDPNRYHRVTVTYGNDGAMDLGYGNGGGSHGRVIWARGPDFDDGIELVAYPQIQTYTFSMADPEALEDDDPSARWLGAPIDRVRFDPNEDPGARGWFIEDFRIAADDESTGPFTVELAELAGPGASAAEAMVSVSLDTDRSGFDGQVVATGIALVPGGTTQVPITTCGLAPGTYWAHINTDRGPASASTYATGPLRVTNGAC